MKVLVTGHQGYIGCVMVPMLVAAGHEVTGVDTCFFDKCTLGPEPAEVPSLRADIRDLTARQLGGFDAVVHLAALSNDPLGSLNPSCTDDINRYASVRLAQLAKQAGVQRYLYASSCSLYGVSGGEILDENAAFNPITPYGLTKVQVEQEVSQLADDAFSPTYLRNATAYGFSPRLRADVVVNNLVGVAFTTSHILIQSDGTPWRPLVHVEDISRAFLAVLQAPRDLIHNQAFNVGRTEENYQVSRIAELVGQVVPGSSIQYAEGGGPDPRCYRVSCEKLARTLPEFHPQWTVPLGIRQLFDAFQKYHLTREDFLGSRYLRIRRITELLRSGALDSSLRWQTTADASSFHAGISVGRY